ncbi:hypothetical protein [Raineya sp.]
MATSFVYFSSGKDFLHNRTIFSVLSLLCYYPVQIDDKILIYTDQINYYQKFLSESSLVEYHLLSQEKIQEMMGDDDLIHRVKIGVIENATLQYPQNNIFYIDSDTFFYQDFSEIISKIEPQTSIMHKFEYQMSFLGTYPTNDKDHFRAVYDLLSQHKFIIQNKETAIPPESFASWNAGIIGLHKNNFHWLKAVYELTDQLYAPTKNHACEQYAFSYFLQTRSKLIDCEKYNRHYWHRIEKKIVDEFLAKKLNDSFANLSLEEKKSLTEEWAKYLLKKIPNHEYMHRYNAMIAFQEKHFWQGYKESLKTLLANPMQDFTFFKDIAYHTKRMLLGDAK